MKSCIRPAYCNAEKKKQLKVFTFVLMLLVLNVMLNIDSFAKIKGSGSKSDPYQGDELAATGDSFLSGMYVKNLTYIDGKKIRIKAVYEAKELAITLSANGGKFPDGSSERKINTRYGEKMAVILNGDNPVYDGKRFSGWYVKGNHKLASDDGSIKTAGDIGDCIYTSDSEAGYMLIDPDDSSDSGSADVDQSGRIIVKALWRTSAIPDIKDGFEADDNTASDESSGLDIWDKNNASNKAIEYLDSCSSREAYSALYGKTKYQYGRAVFCAETSNAEGYSWYIKRKTDKDYEKLSEEASTLKLEKLKSTDNQASIKCTVDFENNTNLTYETELTVFSLPEIADMRFSIDGTEIEAEEVKTA